LIILCDNTRRLIYLDFKKFKNLKILKVTNAYFIFFKRKDCVELLMVNHPLDCHCDHICTAKHKKNLTFRDVTIKYNTKKFYGNTEKYFKKVIRINIRKCRKCMRCKHILVDVSRRYKSGFFWTAGLKLKNFKLDNRSFLYAIKYANSFTFPEGALTLKSSTFESRYWEVIDLNLIDIIYNIHSLMQAFMREMKIVKILSAVMHIIDEL
jgi:hypothetical protein